MTSLRIGWVLTVCVVFTAGTVMLAAPGQSRPGDITQARVFIENRDASDAIPVVVQRAAGPLRVQVAGTPTVSIDPSSTVSARAARQSWEYRAIAVQTSPDPASQLTGLGLDGWEVAGVLQSGPAGATVLLKRPR